MKRPGDINLHVSHSPIVNASRILREAQTVAEQALFRSVIICGTQADGLDENEDLGDGRHIERVGRAPGERKKSVFSRIFGQIRWSIAVYRKYASQEISVVNAHSVAVLPVCRALARKHRARLIYDTHELETETSTSHGVQRWVFKFIEHSFISRCDAVFVVSESIAKWYRSRYSSVDPVVLRNIPGFQRPGSVTAMRFLLSVPEGKKLYIHVGNLVPNRSIHIILDVFASERVDDHIVFLGSGDLEPLVQKAATEHANIHWMAPVPPEEVLSAVAGCDVGLCLITTDVLSYRLSLPNKALEYMAASTPFFFSDLLEVKRILGPDFDRWHLDHPSEQLLTAILSLSDDQITAARLALKEVNIPTWEQESIPMVATYRSLLSLN